MLLFLSILFSNLLLLIWYISQISFNTDANTLVSIVCIPINLVLDVLYIFEKFLPLPGWAMIKAGNLLIFTCIQSIIQTKFETQFMKYTYIISISIFSLGVIVLYIHSWKKWKNTQIQNRLLGAA